MTSEYAEEIPDQDKVRIASTFILQAPPGEFNEVFNDVRVLLSNDQLLKEGAAPSFQKYNEDQFTPAKIEGASDEVLITKHGLIEGQTYYDPRSKQSFSFDHLRKEASNVQHLELEPEGEGLRVAVDRAFKDYADDHYPVGVTTVYAKGDDVISCVEDHKFNPNNFWNGRWRSEWTLNKATGSLKGVLKVQVHYYEDGNVQLVSQKKIETQVKVGDDAVTVKDFIKEISLAENEYQTAIAENYSTMSDTTFKALRRALPITRTKVDWSKILNYKLGRELNSK